MGRNIVCRKFNLGGSTFTPKTFCLWTKVHHLFFIQRSGVVVDQLLFRFSTGRSFREIFAIKVESCQKSRRILASQILGVGLPQKLCPLEHPCLAARRVEKFREVTPTNPKVIGANTLNFKPNFTCSP